MSTPLLEAQAIRIDRLAPPAAAGPAVFVDGLTLKSSGEQVLVLGASRALFEAASAMRPVARGALLVRGASPRAAVDARTAAAAPHEPLLPPKWAVSTYVEWSARLAGHRRSVARDLAREALARFQLTESAALPLGRAAPLVRRATVVAAAVATGAPAILVDDPLGGLPEDAARPFARLLVRALEGRAWVVFAGRVPLASPLALHADEAIVVAGAEVAAQGAPAELAARDASYALRVLGKTEALAALVEGRGGEVLLSGPAQLTVDLREALTTRDLFALAEEAGAVVLELRALARPFA